MSSDDLLRAQRSLGRALDQARAGEDRALAQQVREAGERLTRLLDGLLRLSRMHQPENHAFDQPTLETTAVLRRLHDLLGVVRLVTVSDQVYVNDVRIRFDERIGSIDHLRDDLARHGAGGLRFEVPIDDPAVRSLIRLLSAAESCPRERFAAQLQAAGLVAVTPLAFHRFEVGTGNAAPSSRASARDLTGRLTTMVGEAWDAMAGGRPPNPLPLRRIVNELVENQGDDELVVGEAEALAGPDQWYADHCLRVASLAVVIGRELGLPPASLSDLGLCALFHDVGYAHRLGGQPPGFTEHGRAGLRILLRQRGFHAAKVRRLLATCQHHRDYADPSGRPSLDARILRVADDYDTLTRARDGDPPERPAKAVRRMLAASGTAYDPAAVQALVNHLGRWPPGSWVLLSDGRAGVVQSGARSEATFDLPVVRVHFGETGERLPTPLTVDLATTPLVVLGDMAPP